MRFFIFSIILLSFACERYEIFPPDPVNDCYVDETNEGEFLCYWHYEASYQASSDTYVLNCETQPPSGCGSDIEFGSVIGKYGEERPAYFIHLFDLDGNSFPCIESLVASGPCSMNPSVTVSATGSIVTVTVTPGASYWSCADPSDLVYFNFDSHEPIAFECETNP